MRRISVIGFLLFWLVSIGVVLIIMQEACASQQPQLRFTPPPPPSPHAVLEEAKAIAAPPPSPHAVLEEAKAIAAHVARGKEVLQQPGVNRGNAREGEPFRFVLSPEELGIPDFSQPEVYFESTLLPRSPGRQFVVDVGANTGQFAAAMAKAGVDGVSFEAAPPTCKQLEKRLAAEQGDGRGRVRVVCAAVGAKEGSMIFRMPKDAKTASFKIVKVAGDDTVQVPVVTLDSEVGEGQGVLLLKTDTQGYEMDVLGGAQQLLQSKVPHLLMVEMSHSLLKVAGSSSLQLMELIARHGYVCTHLTLFGMRWPPGTTSFEVDARPHAKKYGMKPTPEHFRRTLSFSEMASLLQSIPPEGKPGWTDLLCW